MEIKEVISYEIYNLKKENPSENEKGLLSMHVDATLKDEKDNKLEVSVNDSDNHDLTLKLFNLIGKKLKQEKSLSQNEPNYEGISSQTTNEINEDASRKHRTIDSPETVIKVVENSAKKTGDYQELPTDNKLDKFEENTDPLTIADLAVTNDSSDDKSKKKEIDLTSSDDGLYHDSVDDQEGDDFSNDEY